MYRQNASVCTKQKKRRKEKGSERGGDRKYAVCGKQEHERVGGKRRMKLETRVYFGCGYVYTYTWRMPFEVQHSIHDE